MEIRDKGVVKKKIPVKRKSFDEVLEEVEIFFRGQGKRLAPYVLKDTLIRIGLPRVKVILEDDKDMEKEMEEREKSETAPTKPTVHTHIEPIAVTRTPTEPVSVKRTPIEPVEPEAIVEDIVEPEPEPEIIPESDPTPIESQPEESGTVTVEDFGDIQEALDKVDALSDSFMTSKPEDETPLEIKAPKIRINIEVSDEVKAADTSAASSPRASFTEEDESAVEEPEIEIIEESPVADDIEEVETEVIATEEIIEESEPEVIVEEIVEPEPELVAPEEEDTQILEDLASTIIATASRHVIKPLVEAKAIILGEEGVGKSSLVQNAGLEAMETNEGYSTYQNERVFETTSHRVKLVVWSFDEAVRSKVTRTDFYADTGVIIIVYAASDRWSFESIDFWLKEAQLTGDVAPPFVLVGNKKDLRGEEAIDAGEDPVTTKEGFTLAEHLAKTLSKEKGKLHRVAFLETSCLTQEGVEDLFLTASELFAKTLPKE
ncbi:MAG: Rab family GTPase [Candidatus Thorarchaeota archaeon]